MPFKDIVYTGESISNSKLDSTPQSSLFSITYIQPVDEYTKNEVRKLQQKVTKMEQEFDIVKERIELEHKARTLLESEVIKVRTLCEEWESSVAMLEKLIAEAEMEK